MILNEKKNYKKNEQVYIFLMALLIKKTYDVISLGCPWDSG
jgi:hypothetical protein